jgi:hypothetical protein
MADKTEITVTISVTEEERMRIEASAQQRGFSGLDDYVRALIESDVENREEEFDPEEPTKESILNGLRQSLQEALAGNTRPISELWAELDDDSA